jgi:hypothetical protein
MTTRFTRLDALVPFAKRRALAGLYTGQNTPANMALIDHCRHVWAFNPMECAVILFTRDIGHHTSGWWKNPDYERCWHLSLSYQSWPDMRPMEHAKDRSQVVAEAFFGDDVRLAWLEPPYSAEGKSRSVWHYRVFADEGWQAFKPRGEVYSRDWTPADWKSFSEIHGYTPEPEDAPFLLEGTR